MQRWISVGLGALFLGAIVVVLWKGGRPVPEPEGARPAVSVREVATARAANSGLAILDDPMFGGRGVVDAGADSALTLPAGAPKSIRFGVVLVTYRGAEGATASARSKEDALALAKGIAESAKADFKAAVAKGDAGSMEDAGRIKRGVLEPAAEYGLFTLAPGAVSEPIDTPRGYWVARRID